MKPILPGLPPALNAIGAHTDPTDTEPNATATELDDPAIDDETASLKHDHDATPPSSAAGKTRAQVLAELADAKAAGLVTYGEQEYPVTPPALAPTKTREQVRSELAQAKAAGQVTYGEQEYPAATPSSGPSKTRAQVRAELAQARAEGLVTHGEQDYPPAPKPAALSPWELSQNSVIDKLCQVIKQLWGRSK